MDKFHNYGVNIDRHHAEQSCSQINLQRNDNGDTDSHREYVNEWIISRIPMDNVDDNSHREYND